MLQNTLQYLDLGWCKTNHPGLNFKVLQGFFIKTPFGRFRVRSTGIRRKTSKFK